MSQFGSILPFTNDKIFAYLEESTKSGSSKLVD